MKNPEFVERLLKITAIHDFCASISWTEKLEFFVNCNDLFFWGCSDLEDISTDKDLDLLEKSFIDAPIYGAELYCARKRNMRPQGAIYKYITKEEVRFFDECGPRREVGPGNPVDKP